MYPPSPHRGWHLVKSVGILLFKLFLDALRDLVLIPVALAAAAIDLVLIKAQEPQYFRAVLRIGEASDRWIDAWSGGDEEAQPRENVDALLARVEEVVRDPKTGARRARILRRWAERQVARARQRAALGAGSRSIANDDPEPPERH